MAITVRGTIPKFNINIGNLPTGLSASSSNVLIECEAYLYGHYNEGTFKAEKGDTNMPAPSSGNDITFYVETKDLPSVASETELYILVQVKYPDSEHGITMVERELVATGVSLIIPT